MMRCLMVLVIGSRVAVAQSRVAGTWLGHLNGVSAVKLTLAEDDGKLSGSVLFY